MIWSIPKEILIIGVVFVTLVVLIGMSALVSRLFVRRHIAALLSSIGKQSLPNFTQDLVATLPVPVQRYFHYALREGQPNIRYAILRQEAEFRHSPESAWFDVRATEYISGMEPGFVWDAVLQHHRLFWRTAKLTYHEGRGSGHIKLYGAVSLQDVEGEETDASMLFRFLCELVWLPTGLLPTRTLRWEEIDATSARAVITDEGTTVQAIVHVNSIGQIERIVTTDKYRDLKSGFEQHQFTLKCREYKEVEGVMIPTAVDFAWNLAHGDFEYGKFSITGVRYFYS